MCFWFCGGVALFATGEFFFALLLLLCKKNSAPLRSTLYVDWFSRRVRANQRLAFIFFGFSLVFFAAAAVQEKAPPLSLRLIQ